LFVDCLDVIIGLIEVSMNIADYQEILFDTKHKTATARQINILRSPKKGGTSLEDSQEYLEELGVEIQDNPQPIQFLPNTSEPVHRWAPYVQGFSAKFVQKTFDRYKDEYRGPTVLDPFSGSGTVTTQAKMNGYRSYGIELNPLLHFVATAKVNSWRTNPEKLLKISRHLSVTKSFYAPDFLKSEKQFKPKVLKNLEKIKGGIDSFVPSGEEDKNIKDLMLLAFSAILIDCSNLKRTPCLGYSRSKLVEDAAPFDLFAKKMEEIAEDLRLCQTRYKNYIETQCEIALANSMGYKHKVDYDLVITSPPYMNGLDYVINYKIEMGWLGYGQNHQELKRLKDEMVVCDNVSKGLIHNFSKDNSRYTNSWIEKIKMRIQQNIEKRGAYRRKDMPEIVHKYFDDMHKIMFNVVRSLKSNGRFILVVGDSLIADVYLPTDLILAKIGQELGLQIESIEKARDRRSGQVRTYKLRETVVTLKKE
jgi:DNA modification methylase